jgi:hypothetical protein
LGKIAKLVHKVNAGGPKTEIVAENQDKPEFQEWRKGEYKLFLWMLIFYCFLHDLKPQELVIIPLFRTKRTTHSSSPSSPAEVLPRSSMSFDA